MIVKIEPCYECGGDCIVEDSPIGAGFWITCQNCGARSGDYEYPAKAISAHNQVSRNNAATGELLKALLELLNDFNNC